MEEPDRPAAHPRPEPAIKIQSRPGTDDQDRRWIEAELTTADLSRMADLTEQYADLGLGGNDASIVAIAECLGISGVATFDRRHFSVVVPNHLDALTLLP